MDASNEHANPADQFEKYGLIALGGVAVYQAGLYFLGLAKADRMAKAELTSRCDALEIKLRESELLCQRLEIAVAECEERRVEQDDGLQRAFKELGVIYKNAAQT